MTSPKAENGMEPNGEKKLSAKEMLPQRLSEYEKKAQQIPRRLLVECLANGVVSLRIKNRDAGETSWLPKDDDDFRVAAQRRIRIMEGLDRIVEYKKLDQDTSTEPSQIQEQTDLEQGQMSTAIDSALEKTEAENVAEKKLASETIDRVFAKTLDLEIEELWKKFDKLGQVLELINGLSGKTSGEANEVFASLCSDEENIDYFNELKELQKLFISAQTAQSSGTSINFWEVTYSNLPILEPEEFMGLSMLAVYGSFRRRKSEDYRNEYNLGDGAIFKFRSIRPGVAKFLEELEQKAIELGYSEEKISKVDDRSLGDKFLKRIPLQEILDQRYRENMTAFIKAYLKIRAEETGTIAEVMTPFKPELGKSKYIAENYQEMEDNTPWAIVKAETQKEKIKNKLLRIWNEPVIAWAELDSDKWTLEVRVRKDFTDSADSSSLVNGYHTQMDYFLSKKNPTWSLMTRLDDKMRKKDKIYVNYTSEHAENFTKKDRSKYLVALPKMIAILETEKEDWLKSLEFKFSSQVDKDFKELAKNKDINLLHDFQNLLEANQNEFPNEFETEQERYRAVTEIISKLLNPDDNYYNRMQMDEILDRLNGKLTDVNLHDEYWDGETTPSDDPEGLEIANTSAEEFRGAVSQLLARVLEVMKKVGER